MNERRLRELLRDVPVPGGAEAERRGLRLVEAALSDRQPVRRSTLPRLAAVLAGATLLAALLMTPAGADVRDWIDDVVTVGARDAEPALTEVPGGGRLLVTSAEGTWVVQPSGSRRLIGGYGEAAWSPRGLFVAAASGHSLSAVEPDGTLRWSQSADAAVSDPRWSPSGFRIAYRAGPQLRVVAGDGSGDVLVEAAAAAVAPAWHPLGPHVLAYVSGGGELRVVNTDTGALLGRAELPADTRTIAWAPDARQLMVLTRSSLLLGRIRVGKASAALAIGPLRRVGLPAGADPEAAGFSPRDGTLASLLAFRAADGGRARAEIVLADRSGTPARRHFTFPGRLTGLTWSPDGRRLLVAWEKADQWLFVPVSGDGRIGVRAIGGIAAQFAPGDPHAVFPRVEGWCCATRP